MGWSFVSKKEAVVGVSHTAKFCRMAAGKSLPAGSKYLEKRNKATFHYTFLIQTTKSIRWYSKENGMALCIEKEAVIGVSRTTKFCCVAAGKSQPAGTSR
eukprot:scaffold6069_cov63-Attheya_sp.AAC.2